MPSQSELLSKLILDLNRSFFPREIGGNGRNVNHMAYYFKGFGMEYRNDLLSLNLPGNTYLAFKGTEGKFNIFEKKPGAELKELDDSSLAKIAPQICQSILKIINGRTRVYKKGENTERLEIFHDLPSTRVKSKSIPLLEALSRILPRTEIDLQNELKRTISAIQQQRTITGENTEKELQVLSRTIPFPEGLDLEKRIYPNTSILNHIFPKSSPLTVVFNGICYSAIFPESREGEKAARDYANRLASKLFSDTPVVPEENWYSDVAPTRKLHAVQISTVQLQQLEKIQKLEDHPLLQGSGVSYIPHENNYCVDFPTEHAARNASKNLGEAGIKGQSGNDKFVISLPRGFRLILTDDNVNKIEEIQKLENHPLLQGSKVTYDLYSNEDNYYVNFPTEHAARNASKNLGEAGIKGQSGNDKFVKPNNQEFRLILTNRDLSKLGIKPPTSMSVATPVSQLAGQQYSGPVHP